MTKALAFILIFFAIGASCLSVSHNSTSQAKRKMGSNDDYDWFEVSEFIRI